MEFKPKRNRNKKLVSECGMVKNETTSAMQKDMMTGTQTVDITCHRQKQDSGVKNTERARAGVAILINKEEDSRISNWKYISQRLIKLDMRALEGDKLSIIVAYGPTESDKKEEKDHFWKELQNELDGAEPKKLYYWAILTVGLEQVVKKSTQSENMVKRRRIIMDREL
ncbi:hypothetical protein QE152_g36286 [Popillia japonica]|uniref:Uncharacterized protein n=1 Tax=Popillia japonica TaxID=7064 RepID=A0AAW1IDG7_POPJA